MSHKNKILNKKYSTNTSMLVIDAFVEYKDNGFLQDLILFEINHYMKNKSIVMSMDVFTLRALAIALEKTINGVSAKFKNHTESSGNTKTLTIGVSSSVVFINLDSFNKSLNSGTKVEHMFGFTGIESLVADMYDICKFTNSELFKAQKMFYNKGN